MLAFALLTLPLLAAAPAEEPRASSTDPFAVYRDGTITREDFESWLRHRGSGGRPAPGGPLEARRLRELVVLRVLAARFAADPEAAEPEYSAWLRLLEEKEAAGWARRRALAEFRPSEAEMRSLYGAEKARFQSPERWRLRNLFLRVPEGAGEEERRALRTRLQGLRARVEAGEDFSRLAREHSDSQTRLRGGRMGAVALAELRPEFAAIVAEMGEGSLGPVIEGEDGFTLLLCDHRVPGRSLTFEEAKERLVEQLTARRFPELWAERGEALLASFEPTWASGIAQSDEPGRTVVSFGRVLAPLTLRDLAFHLRDRKASRPPWELASPELRSRLEERALLAARRAEAERRGFSDDEAAAGRLAWKILELQAALMEDLALEDRRREPTEKELRELFRQQSEAFRQPAERLLEVLRLPIDPGRPAELYERLRRLGEKLAAGEIPFEAVAEAMAPHVRVEAPVWMRQGQVFELGLNAETAIGELEPGGSTAMLQEGPELLIVHLVAEKAERPMTYEEALPELRRRFRQGLVRRARKELRTAILAEQEPGIVAPGRGEGEEP